MTAVTPGCGPAGPLSDAEPPGARERRHLENQYVVCCFSFVSRRRIAGARVGALLRRAPALAIFGPRPIGKSTLARATFADFDSLDLERPADLDRLAADPRFVLAQLPRLVIDEAQRLPALFPALRVVLEEHPRHRVVLLGSASPGLLRRFSESLTGRLAIFELGPVSVFELDDAEALWLRGGFPRLHWTRPRPRPDDSFAASVRTTLEQDIPQLRFRTSSHRLRTLLTMVAHGQGSVQNLSELGGALGIDYHTVAHLLDIFEGTFLVRRLPPFHTNLGKRLVKSPKLYVRDTGMLHALLGMGFSRRQVLAHPKAGASFETFCIEQIVQHARLADPGARRSSFARRRASRWTSSCACAAAWCPSRSSSAPHRRACARSRSAWPTSGSSAATS